MGKLVQVRFYDERGNRLYVTDLAEMPKVGDVVDVPVVREGVLRLVVTVVLDDGGGVIVEPPSMAN